MIARKLLDELQQLNREERLEVIRLLQDDLVDETSEWDDLLSKPGRVFRNIGPIRVNLKEAESLFDSLEEKSAAND